LRCFRKKWKYSETVHQLLLVFKKAYDTIKREKLLTTLIEFEVPMKLGRLIKTCLNETYDKVRVGKYFRVVLWVPCHYGMARPQVADGEDGFQIWRVAANILNKQLRKADKGWSSILGVGSRTNNSLQ
jgi:hypothetical protein